MRMLSRAFEIQNRIDNMLERLWSGNGAIFCDVANEENGNMILFRPEQKLGCDFSHLTDTAGRHFKFFAESCLYRIYDQHLGRELLRGCKNFLDGHFGIDVKVARLDVQALATHLDLMRGLFTRGV